ncbi:hypothetical protein COO60DRAFT_1534529 [Scenedesmus sp. NREL 46B-D3]|nr:hypothetical protein COO60DRAFT_1534529 [Scenedesmus sp. NREL 46B-D3]
MCADVFTHFFWAFRASAYWQCLTTALLHVGRFVVTKLVGKHLHLQARHQQIRQVHIRRCLMSRWWHSTCAFGWKRPCLILRGLRLGGQQWLRHRPLVLWLSARRLAMQGHDSELPSAQVHKNASCSRIGITDTISVQPYMGSCFIWCTSGFALGGVPMGAEVTAGAAHTVDKIKRRSMASLCGGSNSWWLKCLRHKACTLRFAVGWAVLREGCVSGNAALSKPSPVHHPGTFKETPGACRAPHQRAAAALVPAMGEHP